MKEPTEAQVEVAAQVPQSLSYAELIALKPCGAPRRKSLFKNAERLTASEALAAGASIPDLVWVAGRLGLKRQCVQFALACAQRVAHLNKAPSVQGALNATQAWLDNPSDTNAAKADKAAKAALADAAYAAAYAAYDDAAAAYAAAYAAFAAYAAAYDAAYDAAYAAHAAAYDAAFAAKAAEAAEKEEQKKLFLEIFDLQ